MFHVYAFLFVPPIRSGIGENNREATSGCSRALKSEITQGHDNVNKLSSIGVSVGCSTEGTERYLQGLIRQNGYRDVNTADLKLELGVKDFSNTDHIHP